MKKLLVLMLVLSLATIANATLTLRIGGNDTDEASILDSGSIVVSIYKDTTGPETPFIDVGASADLSTKFTLSGAAMTTNAGNMGSFLDISPQAGFQEYQVTIADSAGNITAGIQFNVTVNGVSGQTYDVVVQQWDDGGNNIIDTATIHIVPEPMTLALLGLGGLFIRRK